MHLKCYQKLRRFVHAYDNSKKDEPMNKDNRLYKIQPVLNTVRQNCLKLEPEVNHSIEEQIIPAKTKYSGIGQYNPKKLTKWGFNLSVREKVTSFMLVQEVQGRKCARQRRCCYVYSGLHVIRWLDNKCVQVVSTFVGVEASTTVKRWDGKRKEHIYLPCPDMVRLYKHILPICL